MRRSLIHLALFGLAALPCPALADAPSELDAVLTFKGDPDRGRIAYETCRGCHKADGAGRAGANYPQLAGQHASVLIKQMCDIRAGNRENRKMHPFIERGEVASEDVAHIAAYLAGLPVPADNGKGDGSQLARGGMLYEKDCAVCHGPGGEGDAGKLIPRVAGQHYNYLVQETKAIQTLTGKRRAADPKMVWVIAGYTADDLAAVSDYMSRLRPAP